MPMRETAFQAYTFLAFCYVGIMSALLYDVLLPGLRAGQGIFHIVLDLFLCAATAFGCFLALAVTRCGELRAYMLLALFLGAALYRLGLRRLAAGMINFFRRERRKPKNSE